MREDEKREAREQVLLGEQVNRFLFGEVGKYLLQKAERDRDRAIAEISTVDPHNATEIVRLQSELATPGKVLKWLADAVSAGLVARERLEIDFAENLDC